MICPKCKVEMEIGQAIDPNPGNFRGIVPQIYSVTYKNIKLIDVWKCPKCGYSDDEGLK